MNEHTEALLRDVVSKLQHEIRDRERRCIVALQGERLLVLSDYDYVRDEESATAFEERAARRGQAINVTRWALAVPQVLALTQTGIAARPVSNHPLREGEREAIIWMTCDVQDGVDYGLSPYTRRADREPVFGDVEIFTVAVRGTAWMPGRRLLRALGDRPDDQSI